jgi:hypothetical protein
MSAEPTRQTIEKEGLVDRLSYPSALGAHPTVTVLRPSAGPPSQVLMAAGRHPVRQGCGAPLSEMGSIMGLFASRPMAFRPLYEHWLEEHNHPFHYEHLCYKGAGHMSCPASHRTRIIDHHAA